MSSPRRPEQEPDSPHLESGLIDRMTVMTVY